MKKVTAAELLAQLKTDPNYVARKNEQEFLAVKRQAEHALAEEPLVKDLRAHGADVSTVWDLVNRERPYSDLIPVLITHLERPYPIKVREGIARALAVKESRPWWDRLIQNYLSADDLSTQGLKWGLHLAISAAADATVLDELIKLAVDRRHGRNRALFVDALARIGGPKARAALKELESDADIGQDVLRVTNSPLKS